MIENLYSNGEYGLVDPYYRHVWINVRNEKIAHRIRKTFWSKSPMIVFDLSQFTNYGENVVDSDVSLDWKIGAGEYSSPLLAASLNNELFNQTQTQYHHQYLINEPNHSPLPLSRQKELQYQLLLYNVLFNRLINITDNTINDITWVGSVDKIFQSAMNNKELHNQLFQLAIEFTNIQGSFTILKLLDRYYE